MSATDHAMSLLARLNADDRRWIVERLSEEARTRLTAPLPESSSMPPRATAGTAQANSVNTNGTHGNGAHGNGAYGNGAYGNGTHATGAPANGVHAGAPQASSAHADDARMLEWIAGADPDRVADVLHAEPSWLICAVLRAGPWPWSKAFLKELPPAIRVDVAQLERQHVRLGGASRSALLRIFAERLGPPSEKLPAETAPRFEALLERFRKVRRA